MENGQLDMDRILAQVDAFYEENRGEEAERLMQSSIQEAMNLGDDGARLQLLNELMGYYRETSQKEMVYETLMDFFSKIGRASCRERVS